MITTNNPTLDIILENINNQNVIFVFPTRVAAVSWEDECLNYVTAVASERFTAWDTFKGEAIRSQQQDKHSIPAVMRKFFSQNFISKNAKAASMGKPLLENLINPIYAQEADSFSNWIAKLLPALDSWKRTFEKTSLSTMDSLDKDLLTLHTEYKSFLEANNFFDPAWEQPPFQDKGIKYIIFYPEILNDFSEYRHILENNPLIQLVLLENSSDNLPEEKKLEPTCLLYENSRTELRETMLFIRNLIDEKKCTWQEITINVPDIQTWEPYLKRELELYCIPYVFRSGKKLASYGASKLFKQIQQCISTNFSFNSLKELLLNRHLSWKNIEENNNLISFGIKNSCICSFTDAEKDVDIWKESFNSDSREELNFIFYKSLKKTIKAFSTAKTFAQLQVAYFQFREKMLNAEEFSEESNQVLGRCISELSELIDLEKNFPEMEVENPFAFFISILEEKEYLAQTQENGVSVVPYRLTATAASGCHIILDANQTSLTVLFQKFPFLTQVKRQNLFVEDENPSSAFIKLYQRHSRLPVRFSCSSKSFAGFNIPHNFLKAQKISIDKNNIDSNDFFQNEQKFILSETTCEKSIESNEKSNDVKNIFSIPTLLQKTGFDNWNNILCNIKKIDNSVNKKEDFSFCLDKIQKVVLKKSLQNNANYVFKISPTALSDYLTCPKMWLYKRVLKLSEPDKTAELLKDVWIGIIYHDIIKKYLEPFKKDKIPLKAPEENDMGVKTLSDENKKYLQQCVSSVLKEYKSSPMTKYLLTAQEESFFNILENFIIFFTKTFENYTVVALEQELEAPFSEEHESNECMTYEGKLDCVLSSPNDEIYILDFKTNTLPASKDFIPKNTEEYSLSNFQLTIYIKLWEANYSAKVSGAAFCCIQKPELKKFFGFKKDDDKYLYEMAQTICNKKVEEYAKAIKTGIFEHLNNISFSDCIKCSWKSICRTTYTISGETKY